MATTDSPTGLDPDAGALELFADWVSRLGRGEDAEFEALLHAYPDLAPELRELHATWEQMVAAAELSFVSESAEDTRSATDPIASLAARGASPRRYTLEGEIARGGMGSILRVFDEVLRRRLAMKVVLDERAHGGATPHVSSKSLARFLHEAQVTSQLDHPGVVPVHELGLGESGRLYFTMKLVEGRDLKHIFERVFAGDEEWSETRVLGVILKVCEAVAYAHKKGVIHRDLKPANVMVGNFGEVYVMDWGLARVLGKKDASDMRWVPRTRADIGGHRRAEHVEGTAASDPRADPDTDREGDIASSDSPLMTMDGDVMGTPVYMSPEQARGDVDQLSQRSDVYSIGAMLYHLLAREMPYVEHGTRPNSTATLARVVGGPPRPLHELNRRVPVELAAICDKAMARDPLQRYADTLALAEDLRAYLEHRVVSAYETGAAAEMKKWIARNRFLAGACAAAIVILVVGLVVSSILFVKARTETVRADDKARELGVSNIGLAAATKRAEEKAGEAEDQRAIAQKRTEDVLSLSALQDLQDLIARADALWPAHPENVSKYETWLRDAQELVDGRPAEVEHGIKARPGLADHRAKLAELEARALPQTDAERAAERAGHPRAAELAQKKSRREWLLRMTGVSPPLEEHATALDPAIAGTNSAGLNIMVWSKIDPRRTAYGDEPLALQMARLALERASDDDRAFYRTTVAWALLANARFDDAAAEMQRALAEAPEARRKEIETHLRDFDRRVAEWRSDEIRSQAEQECAGLAEEITELEVAVARRRNWTFESSDDRWWHAQLEKLIADLEDFTDADTGLDSKGTNPKHGWGMEARLDAARTIAERSMLSSDAARRWDAAIASIGDRAQCPMYGGLVIAPQLGLLPIGQDPATKLWEFTDLETGAAVERGADGALSIDEGSGLVFVLLPAGTSWMGAQKTDPAGRNYDPAAEVGESPVQAVPLDAFFLSKYEMTQGQWLRFTGVNPSQYQPSMKYGGKLITLLHPVEQISWKTAKLELARLDLDLPTEAQWEYGARAGTSTPWSTGDEKESLDGAANISDLFSKSHNGPSGIPYDTWLDDGYASHAPVGHYRANPFGLHDVMGNVWELCRDGWGKYDLPVRAGDGERIVSDARSHMIRGGSFHATSPSCRSAKRNDVTNDYQDFNLGLRPARAIRTAR